MLHANSLQSCLTLCDPIDCSAPGSSLEFSRQEYWNGLPTPPPEDLPEAGIEAASLLSPALAGRCFSTSASWEALLSTFLWMKDTEIKKLRDELDSLKKDLNNKTERLLNIIEALKQETRDKGVI